MPGTRRGRWTFAFLAALACLLVAAVGWVGGELHYRNCLSGAELHYPVAFREGPRQNTYLQALDGPSARFVFYEREERNEAIASCSRLP